MAVWPFRRRSSRKRSRSGAALSDTEGNVTKAASQKKRRTEPVNPNAPTRTYSFSPGRRDSIRMDRERGSSPARQRTLRNSNAAARNEECELRERTPTLHHKRGAKPHHGKLTKHKPKDREREAEIKAMSSMTPVRPAAEQWTSGRPMKKDSKRAGGGRPSDVSLPVPGSIHSSLSSDSELGAYKVSRLDVLAPRPTLRYAQGRSTPSPPPGPQRTTSQRKGLIEQEPFPAATIKAHKRIDSLADDLDASELRELMERDKRRREKRKQKERERMERRLAQQAEKQRREEQEARKTGTPPPENLERGVMGRELVGLGIDPASAVVTSSTPRESDTDMLDADAEGDSTKNPIQAFHRTDTLPTEETAAVEPESIDSAVTRADASSSIDNARGASIDERSSIVHGGIITGLLKSVRSRSRSTLASQRTQMVSPPPDTINEEESPRKISYDSYSSAKAQGRFNIKSLLKRARSRKNSAPSSFSNTSREEMQAALAAAHVAQAQAQAQARSEDISDESHMNSTTYVARKPNFGAPKRTRSRFREDLPELPLTPPASRMQSPEADPPMPVLEEHKVSEATSLRSPGARYDTPTSMERAYPSPSPEAGTSMSMASIDSEGSWLSGNVSARRAAMLDSIRRVNQRTQAKSTHSTEEELSITQDEYLSKLAPGQDAAHNKAGRRSGDGRPSSDEDEFLDDADMKWGAVPEQPMVVHRATVNSYEGAIDTDYDTEDSPVSPNSQDDFDVKRARSVNLGKGHVRNFSSGSAKLLDIVSRPSVDDKRSEKRRSSGVLVDL